jgi:tetratricopeptide (TPR) repeat protein
MLAQDRGDYEEAARQYQRSLDIKERLGDQSGMATSYSQLGDLAQQRGDYDEAARQYQRSLDIDERLGDQAGMAISYSQLGNLEKERGGSVTVAVTWHVRALAIRLSIGVPQASNNLHRLAAYRRELGAEPFARLLIQAADNADLAETITSLLDQVDQNEGRTA